MGELRVAQWLLPLVAGAIGLRGGDKTEASLAVGGAATLLLAARSIIDSGRITPPGPVGGAAPMWAPARPDLDCWRHPVGAGRRRYPLPTSSSTAYFDAAAVLLGLAAAAFFLAVLYNNDVDQLAHWVGGRRGASQVDYAPEGSCRLWLTGGPWPTEGVVDAFLLFHFVAFFVVMLAYRDFYLCCILSPLLEVCEASFQHVLPNFKECVWVSLGLDILSFNAFGIWLGYRTLRWLRWPQYDLFGLRPQGARAADPVTRSCCVVGILLLHTACMSVQFFMKHIVAIRETSPWFTLLSTTPILLARSGTEGLVRRHYLGETQLPAVPLAAQLIVLLVVLQIAVFAVGAHPPRTCCAHPQHAELPRAVVPPSDSFRIPAPKPETPLVTLAEGEQESFLSALFLGAPWVTFVVWWPAMVWAVHLAAGHAIHPYTVTGGITLLVAYYTTTRYAPAL